MYRHRRDNHKIIEHMYPIVTVDEYASSNLAYLPATTTVPPNTTNGTIDSSRHIIGSSSLNLANGSIILGNTTLPNTFTLDCWLYLTQNVINSLFTIDSTFSISYNKLSNQFEVRRRLYGTVFETITFPCTLALNSWHLLSVCRQFDTLTIYIDLVSIGSVPYYYSIQPGSFKIGSFTGNLSSFRLNSIGLYPSVISSTTNLDGMKRILNTKTKQTENAELKYLQLERNEIVSNSLVYPFVKTDTYYVPSNQYWSVSNAPANDNWRNTTKGLTLVPDIVSLYPTQSTIDISFSLPQTSSNLVLVSQWFNADKYFYLYYKSTTNELWFVYFSRQSNTIQSVLLGTYLTGFINYIAIEQFKDKFNLYLNGILISTVNEYLHLLQSGRFQFNYNVAGIVNTGNKYYLVDFVVSRKPKYTQTYLPYSPSSESLKQPITEHIYNYHGIEHRYDDKMPHVNKFTVTGSSTITPGSTNTYTIIQKEFKNVSTTYSLSILLSVHEEVILEDITIPASVNLSGTTITFTVGLNTYAVNPYKKHFTLNVCNGDMCQQFPITISDSRTLDMNYVTSLNGYIDGYLTANSVTNGIIPNLTNTHNATSSTNITGTDFYGKVYGIAATTDVIQFPTQLENIQTAFIIYRELQTTPNRLYFGNDTAYTFNGGLNGELVGSLALTSSEYIQALDINYRAFTNRISGNDTTFVILDDLLNKVYIFSKVNGLWNNSPTELNLGLSDSTLCQGASLAINYDGNVIAIGLKNGNNGEGVAQVWTKTNNIWTKDLHLGTPISGSPGGFGQRVAISNNGLRLFVSELSSNHVYIFEKNTLWNPDPVDAFIGSNRFGFDLDTNSAGTVFTAVSIDDKTTHIYRLNNGTWSQELTLSFGETVALSPNGNSLVIGSASLKTVKLYSYTSSWSLQKTLSNTIENYGYSVSISDNNNIFIGSPTEHKTYLHFQNVSWDNPLIFTGSNNYGYDVHNNNSSILNTDYASNINLITVDASSVPQDIIKVRQKGSDVPLNTLLDTTDVQILSFYSSVPLKISQIGKGKSNTSLNGLVLGCLFFNRLLSSTEIINIETLLSKYLHLYKYGT